MRKSAPRRDANGRPRKIPAGEVAAVWLLPLLGVAVLALVWLV
jgi:hypothetical protein